MKKQFKPGDTVRLKNNLKVGKWYEHLKFYESMKFEGERKIKEVSFVESVRLEGSLYIYHFDMLMKVPKKKTHDD